jgi:phosphodiesterase/alkaline phosphatase D-like protein
MTILIYLLLFASSFQTGQKIVLGPIIGKVTTTTARILIEFKIAEKVTLGLISQISSKVDHFSTVEVFPSHPAVFFFQNLIPGLRYDVVVDWPSVSGESSFFRTLSESKEFNMAFVSCNHLRYSTFIPIESSLWTDIARRAANGELDYLFHIGDQVYLDSEEWSGREDSAFSRSKNQFPDFLNHKEEIREIIRDDYRKTFGYHPTALALSRVPNIMILDDHEVHNDFARKKAFRIKGTWEEFWSSQARYVYYQYQRQLREDIDFSRYEEIPEEFFTENFKHVDFFFMDYRSGRIWDKNWTLDDEGQLSYLEKKQENALIDFFSGGSNVKLLINSVPIFMFDVNTTRYLAHNVCEDYDEFWTYNHEDELVNFFNLMRKWKMKGNREVFFIGGDQHYAFHSEIFFKNKGIFKQLTTSGIVMDGLEQEDIQKLNLIMDKEHCISENYCIRHLNWTYLYNYAIVKVNNLEVSSQLIVSDGKEITTLELISNYKY